MMKAKKKKKKMSMYDNGGKTPFRTRKNVTKKAKKEDEEAIDQIYSRIVGINNKTGELNYPNSADMDKIEATVGMAGDPNKLRKAISDRYYAEQRKEMGLDKIKTFMKGGMMEEMMKLKKFNEGGFLKEVPEDAKGLAKLPKSVRNKMGYARYGAKVVKK